MPYMMKIMPKGFNPAEIEPARRRRRSNNVVAVLAYDGVSAFELGIAVEMFGLSGLGYRVLVCADRPRQRLSATGVKIVVDAGLEALGRAGTIIVPGWHPIEAKPSDVLLAALERAHARKARIASICSGVFALAAAGLLDDRRAAVHWANAEALAQMYPRVQVDPDVLYVDDGDILTSAGRAAGLDLCLHIIRRDHGAGVANRVARRFVIAPHREGGQAQFIVHPVRTEGDPLTHVFDWARQHIDRDMSIDRLAEQAHMSRRTFIRRFEEATGDSPGAWIVRERVTQARDLLESTDLPVEQVATMTGFGTADTLRHHFRKRLRTTPNLYRATFRAAGDGGTELGSRGVLIAGRKSGAGLGSISHHHTAGSVIL
jgi:AraC family transcriptional regulator, transcriptional activator FtrA